MVDIESNMVQDLKMNGPGVGETFFVPKDVMDLQKLWDMNPHALESYKEGTWAKLFFPEAEKSMLIPCEKASKPNMMDKPNKQAVQIIKVDEFPSNSEAPKMKKDLLIPGLFTTKRRAKEAKMLNKVALMTKVN